MAGRPKRRAQQAALSAAGAIAQLDKIVIPDIDEDGRILGESNEGKIDPLVWENGVPFDELDMESARQKNENVARQMAEDAAQIERGRQEALRIAREKQAGQFRDVVEDQPMRVTGEPQASAPPPVDAYVMPQGDIDPNEVFIPEDEELPDDVQLGVDPVADLPQPKQDLSEQAPQFVGHNDLQDRVEKLERVVNLLLKERENQKRLNQQTAAELADFQCVENQEGKGCGAINRYPKRWQPGTRCIACGHTGLLQLD